MKIRPLTSDDADAVLALNAASVTMLSPLDHPGLTEHLASSTHAVACELETRVAGFALALGPGSTYDSINYRWHECRFDDFLYLDRIVVDEQLRRRGIATLLYDELETYARPHGRMVCEVNSEPPNVASLAFHRARGYREVGHLRQADGHETVMMEKPL
ncbi:MAG: GNAT family N-acetyltransferase [Nocardioidaceae bacterium]